jgi:hypothetical protein
MCWSGFTRDGFRLGLHVFDKPPQPSRLRCNTCGAYFTAEAPLEVTLDGPLEQRYGYTARARATASGKGFLSSFL